jgi:hypothetical protein
MRMRSGRRNRKEAGRQKMIVDEEDFSVLHPKVREILRHCERELVSNIHAVIADSFAAVPECVRADIWPSFEVIERGLPGAILRADLEFFKMTSDLVVMKEALEKERSFLSRA